MKVAGRVHRYGDNVDTDVIIPARYLNTSDPKELAKYCMIDIDKDFTSKVKPEGILWLQERISDADLQGNMLIAIKASGISCVIAETFARIFTEIQLISDYLL